MQARELFHSISVPVADMREKPTANSPIVSQTYYSEMIDVIQNEGDWVKIKTRVDQYTGWVKNHTFCQNDSFLNAHGRTAKVRRLSAHLYHMQDTIYGPVLTLPFESKMRVIEESEDSRWFKVVLPDGGRAYIQSGDVDLHDKFLDKNEMCALSLRFLGLPYTWGGRTSFGYDCSGFVQMLYRQMNVFLPRDSSDQMRWAGFSAVDIENLLPGDLIFFGPSIDRVVHVGMCLEGNTFIHSTVAENAPYIRVSQLSGKEWNGSGKLSYRAARRLHVI